MLVIYCWMLIVDNWLLHFYRWEYRLPRWRREGDQHGRSKNCSISFNTPLRPKDETKRETQSNNALFCRPQQVQPGNFIFLYPFSAWYKLLVQGSSFVLLALSCHTQCIMEAYFGTLTIPIYKISRAVQWLLLRVTKSTGELKQMQDF